MTKKKSQMYGQIFVYILTIVLISFILIYGYNAVQNFKTRATVVSCLKFKEDLSNSITSIISDYGSVKNRDFKICGGYSEICFVESLENPDISSLDIDPLIRDSILSGADDNIFLIDSIAKESFYIGKISVDPDIICISAKNNQISLRLEGAGDHALLSG